MTKTGKPGKKLEAITDKQGNGKRQDGIKAGMTREEKP